MNQVRVEIPFEKLSPRILTVFANDWMLLASGDFASGKFNFMTIGWGSLGTMWSKPFAMVVARPQRHTVKFLDSCDSFTLTVFPEKYRAALSLCGSKSGKDIDKVKESGLMPIKASKVSSPIFAEAELAIECKKIYIDAFKSEGFVDPAIIKHAYPLRDFHKIYLGEILAVSGTSKYAAEQPATN